MPDTTHAIPSTTQLDGSKVSSLRAILGPFSPDYGGNSPQRYLSDTAVRIETGNGIVTIEHALSPYAGGFLVKIQDVRAPCSHTRGDNPVLSGAVVSKDGIIQELWIRDGDREQPFVTHDRRASHPFMTALLPIAKQRIDDILAAPAERRHRSPTAVETEHAAQWAAQWFLDSDVADEIRRSGCRLRVSTDSFVDGGLFSREPREIVDTTCVSVTAPGRFPWTKRTLAVLEIRQVFALGLDEPAEILTVTRYGIAASGRGLEKAFHDTVDSRKEALSELGQVVHQMSLLSL